MKKNRLFALWGGLFILCAALGFSDTSGTALQLLKTLLSVVFFAPAALLLKQAHRAGDKETLLLVRSLAAASLALTAALLILNFLSALWPAGAGDVLYSILIVVSSPMICSGHWALSLFLWACLIIVAAKLLKNGGSMSIVGVESK